MIKCAPHRFFASSIITVRNQFQYLLSNPSIPPTSLKWRQLLNAILGSRKGEWGCLSEFPPVEVLGLISSLMNYPSQPRHHEVFALCGSRLVNLPISLEDHVLLMRCFLGANLRVAHSETKRYRSRQVAECINIERLLVDRFFDQILTSDKIPGRIACEVVYVYGLVSSRAELEHPSLSDRLAMIREEAIQYILDLDVGEAILLKAETLWGLSIMGQHEPLRRVVTESEILTFDVSKNRATPRTSEFRALLQLRSGLSRAGLSESSLYQAVNKMIADATCDASKISVIAEWIWWSSMVQENAEELSPWAKICVSRRDSLTENEKWMVTAALSSFHANDPDMESYIEAINRPRRSSIGWRRTPSFIS
jgi:hypothetical protein